MKISTEIFSSSQIVGEQRAVELVAKAGFDAWDFTMFSMHRFDKSTQTFFKTDHPLSSKNALEFSRNLKKIGFDNGIICNQAHAPYPSSFANIDTLKTAIECAAEAGANIIVVHPMNKESAEKNAELYNLLLPFAKQHNVKIAAENMWNWDNEKNHSCFAACATPESFNKHLDLVNDEFLVACLDIGHAEMKGSETSAEKMILSLGNRLKALHIHDNDKLFDLHKIPYTDKIDFDKIAAALRKIGYSGYLTLEANRAFSELCESQVPAKLNELYLSVNKLKNKIING